MPNAKTVAIVVLTVLLGGTNSAWAYWAFDTAITWTYTLESLKQTSRCLNQALALLPEVAKPGTSRADVLAAALAADPDHIPPSFDKDGVVQAGWIILKFDDQGRLIGADNPFRLVDP